MTGQAIGRRSMSFGPFLTLLVLATSSRIVQGRHRLTAAETIPWHSCSQTVDSNPHLIAIHGNSILLGPFITLILTLRCRNTSESGSGALGKGTCHVGPCVRIGASP